MSGCCQVESYVCSRCAEQYQVFCAVAGKQRLAASRTGSKLLEVCIIQEQVSGSVEGECRDVLELLLHPVNTHRAKRRANSAVRRDMVSMDNLLTAPSLFIYGSILPENFDSLINIGGWKMFSPVF